MSSRARSPRPIGAEAGASADAHGILSFSRERLAAYKTPRALQFVGDLPKTSTGKIVRRELRKLDT
jgi:long-chain acyl-CoA synthetase